MLKLKLGATIVYEARAVDIRIRVQNVKSGTANAAIAVVVAVETVIVARSARRMHSSAQAIFWARRVDHVSTVVVSSRRRNIGTGAMEIMRSLSKERFARDLRRLVPSIQAEDLVVAPSGVRAQAVDRKGKLVDDFVIETRKNQVHILNAPSPAATASLAIARYVTSKLL